MDRLEGKEEAMRLFEKCPICGGEVVEKEVEKLLKGGKNTAVVRITAEVCLHCGERLYYILTIRLSDLKKSERSFKMMMLKNLFQSAKRFK